MSDRIYCYPDFDVLINRLSIHDMGRPLEAERKPIMFRLMGLLKKPVSNKPDLEHLRSIHKYIFQDIYPWAGKIHTVDTIRPSIFCKVRFIEMQTREIFGKLQKDNYLKQLSKEKFAKRTAYYFSETNTFRLFREGNGRTQRGLVQRLACEPGYILHLAAITETETMEVNIDSFVYDYKKMEALFTKIIEVR